MPLKVVMWLASPYLAGRTFDDAIRKAHLLYRENRFTSTIDILGEDAANEEEADGYVTSYKKVIEAVSALPLPCQRPAEQMTISFKPSMFSSVVPTHSSPDTNGKLAKAYERMKSVVDHALKHNVRMTLEAEDHRWADFHLDTYFSLVNAGYTNLGTVLQSRLFRTKNDIKKFDDRMRVRLVIGIYNEPAEVAEMQKPVMKDRLVDYAASLAEKGVYLEIASHDEQCIGNFFKKVAIAQKLPPSSFETQYLLGVPRKEMQQGLVSGKYFVDMAEDASGNARNYLADLARTGTLVRMYLPYGTDAVAGPYCKRRLKANPNMISYGVKNFFHIK